MPGRSSGAGLLAWPFAAWAAALAGSSQLRPRRGTAPWTRARGRTGTRPIYLAIARHVADAIWRAAVRSRRIASGRLRSLLPLRSLAFFLILAVQRASLLVRENAPPLQMMLVSAVLVAVVAQTALYRRRSQVDLLIVLWALVTWAFPLTQANVSYWRSEAALAPLAILVARLPRAVLVSAVAAFVVVSVPLAWLSSTIVWPRRRLRTRTDFFTGTLVSMQRSRVP